MFSKNIDYLYVHHYDTCTFIVIISGNLFMSNFLVKAMVFSLNDPSLLPVLPPFLTLPLLLL